MQDFFFTDCFTCQLDLLCQSCGNYKLRVLGSAEETAGLCGQVQRGVWGVGQGAKESSSVVAGGRWSAVSRRRAMCSRFFSPRLGGSDPSSEMRGVNSLMRPWIVSP